MAGNGSRIRASIRNALKDFSQCHPEHRIDSQFYQSIIKRIEGNLKGQLRVVRRLMKTLPSDNLRMLVASIELELARRGDPPLVPASERVLQLETAIRNHRDQRGDDRCWIDDVELYALLPEGKGNSDLSLCHPDEMIENCKRYISARQDPSLVYISSQRKIEELEQQIKSLKDSANGTQ